MTAAEFPSRIPMLTAANVAQQQARTSRAHKKSSYSRCGHENLFSKRQRKLPLLRAIVRLNDFDGRGSRQTRRGNSASSPRSLKARRRRGHIGRFHPVRFHIGQRFSRLAACIAEAVKSGLLAAPYSYKDDGPMTMDRASISNTAASQLTARDTDHRRSPWRYY